MPLLLVFSRTIPARCPKCDSEHLYHLGAGSEQGEERLAEIFFLKYAHRPRWIAIRSGDATILNACWPASHSGEINLLVGTQMIAKGHDIHITLVGVVGATTRSPCPTSRAAERVASS